MRAQKIKHVAQYVVLQKRQANREAVTCKAEESAAFARKAAEQSQRLRQEVFEERQRLKHERTITWNQKVRGQLYYPSATVARLNIYLDHQSSCLLATV